MTDSKRTSKRLEDMPVTEEETPAEQPKQRLTRRFAGAQWRGTRWVDADGQPFTDPELRQLHQYQDAEKMKERMKALGGG